MIPVIKKITFSETPWSEPCDAFARYAHTAYSVLLTGKGPVDRAQFSLIGYDPHSVISHDGNKLNVKQETDTDKHILPLWDAFHKLTEALRAFEKMPSPIRYCGAVGFISYDALTTIEQTQLHAQPAYELPLFTTVLYNHYIVFDHVSLQAYNVTIEYGNPSRINELFHCAKNNPVIRPFQAECGREGYIDKVNRVKNYILDGDVYEVSLSQQFKAEFDGDPYRLFQKVFAANPASYSAYFSWDKTAILCNSPELFVRADGQTVETRPIKGTIRRGKDTVEDEQLKQQLLASEKDQAELYMIVDLLRNDLGKVCTTGSVTVDYAKQCETYETVHHLVARVTGKLNGTYADLLRAVFPGGSITGCPKIRSTEIIDELETYRRHLYTGSMFVMNSSFLVANITIRTGIIQNNMLFINSGGAVTIDSDPAAEYDEIMHKVQNFFNAAGQS